MTDPTFETLRLDWPSDAIVRLVLDRQESGNALGSQLIADLRAAAAMLRFRSEVKAAILTAEGKFFCAGADLKETDKPPHWLWSLRDLMDEIEALPFPVIAAINGTCRGGGTELALAADLRLIAASTAMGLPEVRFGALPAAGGFNRLLPLVGPARAKQMIMTAEPVPAAEAVRIGLAEEAVADAELQTRALALAEQIAGHAGYATRAAKLIIDRSMQLSVSDGLAWEYQVVDTMATPEERAEEVQKAMAASATYAKLFKR